MWGLLVFGKIRSEVGGDSPISDDMSQGRNVTFCRFIKEAPDTNREAMKNKDDECG